MVIVLNKIFYLFFLCINFYFSFFFKMFLGLESILLGKRMIIFDFYFYVIFVY